MKKLFLLIFIFITNISHSQNCEDYSYYGNIKICLPKMNNMIECYEDEDVKEWSDQFKGSDDEQILGLYMLENDYENFYSSILDGFDQYFKIYATNSFKNIDFEKEMFELVSEEIIKVLDNEYSKVEGLINNRVDEIFEGELKINKPFLLDNYKLDENINTTVSLMKLITQNAQEEDITLITILNTALIKKKIIFFAYYEYYDGPESIKKARTVNDLFGLKLMYNNL